MVVVHWKKKLVQKTRGEIEERMKKSNTGFLSVRVRGEWNSPETKWAQEKKRLRRWVEEKCYTGLSASHDMAVNTKGG